LEIRSLADFVRMTRGVLAAAGLVRHEDGGTVWFEGGPADGPLMVLVHGVNDQAGSWFTVVPSLAKTHHLVVPDLAGHGESEPRSGPLPMSSLLASLETAIGNRRDLTLAGNSLGGWIAMLYALDHPARVRRLVLEASGGLDRPFASPVIATNRDEAIAIIRAVHGPGFRPPDWSVDALLARAASSPLVRVTGSESLHVDARLRELSMPVTIIWGAQDGVLPIAYAEALRDGIPNATLHVVEEAAHIPHIQQPERFLQCLSSTF
jgi:pimeloyl-ACP methyl ester carboxylesterase